MWWNKIKIKDKNIRRSGELLVHFYKRNFCFMSFPLIPLPIYITSYFEHTYFELGAGSCHDSMNLAVQHNWEATHSLQTTSVTVCSMFISDHVVYLHLYVSFLPPPLPTNVMMMQIKKQNTTINTHSSNLNSSNMCNLRVIKCVARPVKVNLSMVKHLTVIIWGGWGGGGRKKNNAIE
jgi:hypothetical protein